MWRADGSFVTAREGFYQTESLQPGSYGCSTPGFQCTADAKCVNDKCVPLPAPVELTPLATRPLAYKDYYSHDGDRWMAGFGETCSAAIACHAGMACVDGAQTGDKVCKGLLAEGQGDCRTPNMTCAPEFSCSTASGTCVSSVQKSQ